FSKCSRLTSLTIGNSVTYLGISAFNHCSSLTSV
ncbi:leucine-rich repeat protein, partial [Flavobacterium psychrophilum]